LILRFVALFAALFSIAVTLVYIQVNERNRSKDRISNTSFEYDVPPEIGIIGAAKVRSLPIRENLIFAGEPVPLYIPDVRERFDRELHINTYWHSNTIGLIKRSHRWFPVMEEILKREGVPEDFKYLPVIESGLANEISPRNAVGYWQIIASAGKELGLEINREVDERYDPVKSTEAACTYLKKAYAKFGSWTAAAASYNRGISGLNRAFENQKVEDFYDLMLNEETSRYVFRIIAIKEIMENLEDYGFIIDQEHVYKPEKVNVIQITETIHDLTNFAIDQGINIKLLKRHNPWLRSDRLTVTRGQTYEIAIPLN